MSLRLATWNINSVRLRIDNVRRLIAEWAPDVLCLQETKTPDELFPREAFEALGYRHRLVHGMKGYNGVAILSRLPFASVRNPQLVRPHRLPARDRGAARRHRAAQHLCSGRRRHCRIPEANPKFAHKLQFLDELTAWFAAERGDGRPMIAVGDLNIAPLEADVWSHKQLLSVVSHTPVEVERLGRLQQAGGFVDAVRHFVAAAGAALHLVELSRPRLGRLGPRPPPRSYLGDAGADRRRRRDADPSRQPRLGQSLRPCPGHGVDRGLMRR